MDQPAHPQHKARDLMKIHATRVEAPTAVQPHGTKWQVIATLANGDQYTFARVLVNGPCEFYALPENTPIAVQPRVYAEPLPNVPVFGFDEDGTSTRLDSLESTALAALRVRP